MDYEIIKYKIPDFFCIKNLREIHKNKANRFKISFVDFLMCIEDFYTFVYSPKLSRTSWLLFTWLRTLVRYDGYVTLSYKDVSTKFCGDKGIISKPTFFKCIEELDAFGLVKKITNRKLFGDKIQKDTNTYIVISKVNEILPLLKELDSQQEFYTLLKQNFLNVSIQKKVKKQVQVSENTKEYSIDYIMNEYRKIQHEIEDFFVFLGSNNKSGKIAKSRKQKILNIIFDIKPNYKDLKYAISQTISKGVKNEKYLYAILKNLYNLNNEVKPTNEIDEKLKDKYNHVNVYRHISDEDYKKYKNMIFEDTENGYEHVLEYLYKLDKMDYLEEKLFKVCTLIRKKRRWLRNCVEAHQLLCDRERFLRANGISEEHNYAPNGNQLISWVYYIDDEFTDKIVPLDEIEKLFKQKPELFKYASIQCLDGGVYK